MKVNPKQYASLLYELTEGKSEKEISSVLQKFSSLLKKNNHLSKIDLILREFNVIWNKKKNIVNASIFSAREIDADLKKVIIDYVIKSSGASEVVLDEKINKEILGGVVIKYQDKIIDNSLKNRVKNLARILEK